MTVIRQESFAALYEELLPIFREHWVNLGPYRDKMPLSPDRELYGFLEKTGALLMLTARHEGELLGYIIIVVKKGLHYSTTLQAITDIPYVKNAVRGRGVGVKLFLAAQEELKARGVGPWFASLKIGSHLEPSMHKLLTWMGMTPCDRQYSKWID